MDTCACAYTLNAVVCFLTSAPPAAAKPVPVRRVSFTPPGRLQLTILAEWYCPFRRDYRLTYTASPTRLHNRLCTSLADYMPTDVWLVFILLYLFLLWPIIRICGCCCWCF
jgi:hypothetical protein